MKTLALIQMIYILGTMIALAIWELIQWAKRRRLAMKAKYIGATDAQVNWREHDDPRGLLVEGRIYAVDRKVVDSGITDIYLKGIKGRFNSVCFEELAE